MSKGLADVGLHTKAVVPSESEIKNDKGNVN